MRGPWQDVLLRQRITSHRLPWRNLRIQQRVKLYSQVTKTSKETQNGIVAGRVETSGTVSSSAGPGAAQTSIWMRLGPLTTMANAFARAQRKRPYIVQTASALVIFASADVSAQYIGGSEYEPIRTARSALIGMAFAIPQYRWFFVLARYFNYKSKALSIGAKVIFNQFSFAIFFPTYFFGTQALLSGEGLEGTVKRLQDTVPRSWQNSWKVWPAAMTFNLALVPLEYRAIFSGLVAVGWQTYLSWMNRQAEIKEEVELATEVQGKPLMMPVQVAEGVLR